MTNDVIKIINNSRIFFVKTDYLNYFENTILPRINHQFILVSTLSDYNSGRNEKIINNKYLIKWFGQNMIPNNKTQGIPMGLESVDWGRTDVNIIEKYKNTPKTELLYFNFSNTNPARRHIKITMLNNGFTQNSKKDWANYMKDLSR